MQKTCNRDFSRFSEECQGYDVVGFERVTFRPFVRSSVRPLQNDWGSVL